MFKSILNILLQKCPRCHKGKMFNYPWYNLNKISEMPEKCNVCGQRTELEVGFYYGTGYISYALTIAFLVFTFIVAKLFFNLNFKDNSIFWWLGISLGLLVLLQPFLIRTSRLIWLSIFFHKDDEQHTINIKN